MNNTLSVGPQLAQGHQSYIHTNTSTVTLSPFAFGLAGVSVLIAMPLSVIHVPLVSQFAARFPRHAWSDKRTCWAVQAACQVTAFARDSRGDGHAYAWQLLGTSHGSTLRPLAVEVSSLIPSTSLGHNTGRS